MSSSQDQQLISIEVVLATPERQKLIALEVQAGSNIEDAIAQSKILEEFEGFDLDPARVGIFGRKAAMTDVLRAGDRIEIYRPLIADPKESRRQRALKQAQT